MNIAKIRIDVQFKIAINVMKREKRKKQKTDRESISGELIVTLVKLSTYGSHVMHTTFSEK